MGRTVQSTRVWVSLRRFGLDQIAPLVAVAIGAVYTVYTVASLRTGAWLVLCCATPLAAVASCALVSTLLPPRTARTATLLAIVATPVASGCVPASLTVLRCWDPTRAFEQGALASILILVLTLPVSIAWARTRREPAASALRRAAGRGLWLVAAMTLAWGASLSWKPPETDASADPSFDAILWNPPSATWLDELRSTATVAALVVCACGVILLVVTMRDWTELKRIRGHETAPRSPPLAPYRHAAHVPAAPDDASALLRRWVRTDLVCLILVGCSALYLFGRIQHLESNMEVAEVTHEEFPRRLAVPSLRHACGELHPHDTWQSVSWRLSRSLTTYEQVRAGHYRWRPQAPRGGRSPGSCYVTFDERDRYFPTVLVVEYRDDERSE